VGFERNYKKQANGIGKERVKKNFGSTKERDGTWGIKANDELDKLIRRKNIINHIKAPRLSWLGHLHRMAEERVAKKYISEIRC
jgi:hypothetical protein